MTTATAHRGTAPADYTPTVIVSAINVDEWHAERQARRMHTTRRLINRYRLRELMAIEDVREAEDAGASWPELDFLKVIRRNESALVRTYRAQLARLEASR